MEYITDLAIPILGVLIGSWITVWIFKKSEAKKKAEERLSNLNKLMKLTNSLCLQSSEILFQFNIRKI
ncbi:hypothetical protein [Oceanobacillus sp. FSL W7-1309]|uniref:hypothetical protein n=1 Tax=Oceanobacillus sp. FSL W7-1309 TaxID=2954539 RepID=UPI0030F4E1CC